MLKITAIICSIIFTVSQATFAMEPIGVTTDEGIQNVTKFSPVGFYMYNDSIWEVSQNDREMSFIRYGKARSMVYTGKITYAKGSNNRFTFKGKAKDFSVTYDDGKDYTLTSNTLEISGTIAENAQGKILFVKFCEYKLVATNDEGFSQAATTDCTGYWQGFEKSEI